MARASSRQETPRWASIRQSSMSHNAEAPPAPAAAPRPTVTPGAARPADGTGAPDTPAAAQSPARRRGYAGPIVESGQGCAWVAFDGQDTQPWADSTARGRAPRCVQLSRLLRFPARRQIAPAAQNQGMRRCATPSSSSRRSASRGAQPSWDCPSALRKPDRPNRGARPTGSRANTDSTGSLLLDVRVSLAIHP